MTFIGYQGIIFLLLNFSGFFMALLPIDPAPSSVQLTTYQPSGKSTSVSGKPQSRSSGIHQFEVSVGYDLLEFDQRDILMAFLTSKTGRVIPFDIFIPTYSDSNGIISSTTALCNGVAAVDATTITLRNVDGELKPYNLIAINGQSKVYSVSNPSTVVGGVQTIDITPPLKVGLADGAVVNIKNVPISVTLDSDNIGSDSKGMSATVKFTAVEEL